jgi:hypothetical protein
MVFGEHELYISRSLPKFTVVSDKLSFTAGRYTTTVTTNITVPVTSTGTPSCSTCSTPVTVYDPPAGTYRTTVTGNVTAPVTSTGRPTCATCSTPVTVYDPSTSSTPSGTTSSTIPTNTPDASCNNRGLAYAVYNNPYTNVYSQTDPYASYNVTYFQTAPVEYQNTTTHLGYSVASGGHSQVYGKGPVYPASNITINHVGTFTPRKLEITHSQLLAWMTFCCYG